MHDVFSPAKLKSYQLDFFRQFDRIEATGCLQSLFEEQVDAYPEALALVSSEQSLTYAEVEVRSNQIAHFMRDFGVGPGQLVGLYFDRSVEAVITILGCLKSGAGYVPIDPVFPEERIRHILSESEAALILTQRAHSEKMRSYFSGEVLAVDLLSDEIAQQPTRRLSMSETGASPEDICYVIYTSGTTGRPKGVVAEHRHAYKYALAFNEACTTTVEDRIYQGFSLGFDGSIEEIWMAFSNGATLVAPTSTTARFGNDLAQYLNDQEVTYFSTVPTLLSTITDEIPSLRQLIVSGEACPPELVDRWAIDGREMYNVYGPTEATVNTTSVLCRPGQPITIGRPLRGYHIHILDESLCPVPTGSKGQLYIGGETLARGYLNREDLTQERFIEHPTTGERLYCTGDLVRWNDANELEFFGRIDGQIKIRGYRIELSEIEAVLLDCDGVQSAAVRAIDRGGLKQLAAYVIVDKALSSFDIAQVLKKRLPPYMVPSYLDFIDAFPMLASGKVDRKLLPDPINALVVSEKEQIAPETEVEKNVAEVWKAILGLPEISVESDFFKELGGYSLLAGQVVTKLRADHGMNVAIRDLYKHPTVRQLSEHIDRAEGEVSSEEAKTNKEPTAREVYVSVPKWERRTVKALQVASIFGMYLIGTIPFSILVYVLNSVLFANMDIWRGVGMLFALGLVSWPIIVGTAIVAKWALIGRYKPGKHPLWSFFYFRWWLVNRLHAVTASSMFAGTPLLPLYYRLMGAKVGKGCVLDTALCSAWDLIEIGDDTTVSADSHLLGYQVEGGYLHLGRVTLGDRCFVGGHSALGLDVTMEDDSILDEQSHLTDGTRMKAGERRNGSPAVVTEMELPVVGESKRAWKRPILWSMVFLSVLAASWVGALVLSLAYLALFAMAILYGGVMGGVAWFALSVPVGIVGYCLLLVALRHLIMPKAKTGVFPVASIAYVRRWMLDGMMRTNRIVLKPIYTTLYLPTWLRMMGAKIGKRAEISTVWYCSPELLEISEESFFADGCIVGGRKTYLGMTQIEKNRIGRRSFVGNGAKVPGGKDIGKGCLLGVLSAPPRDGGKVEDGTEWLGNPAFPLPNRPKNESFDQSETFQPTKKLYAQRAFIDGVRVVFPGYLGTLTLLLEVGALIFAYWKIGLLGMILISPFISFTLSLFSIGAVVLLKRCLMGQFKPVVKPLWCTYVWKNELVNGAYESVMIPLVSLYHGTPFIAAFLRWMGVKVGKRTYIDSILFSEFDLIEIGDYASLDIGSVLQNHLFEDRVFKSSHLKIGESCSIGNMAIVLYDTDMKKGSRIAPLSLLMKGETLGEDTRWRGIPTSEVT